MDMRTYATICFLEGVVSWPTHPWLPLINTTGKSFDGFCGSVQVGDRTCGIVHYSEYKRDDEGLVIVRASLLYIPFFNEFTMEQFLQKPAIAYTFEQLLNDGWRVDD